VDELWTFVPKKQARLSFEDRLRADVGDQYCFLAIDAETKLIPHFDVGKRNMITAYRFMEALTKLTRYLERLKGGARTHVVRFLAEKGRRRVATSARS
jgi:hypothetical protein